MIAGFKNDLSLQCQKTISPTTESVKSIIKEQFKKE